MTLFILYSKLAFYYVNSLILKGMNNRRIMAAALVGTPGKEVVVEVHKQWLLEEYITGKIAMHVLTKMLEDSSKENVDSSTTSHNGSDSETRYLDGFAR